MDELVILRVTEGSWAADVEEMGFGSQGEYISANYTPVPPTAPILPPPSSTYLFRPTTHDPSLDMFPHIPTSPPVTPLHLFCLQHVQWATKLLQCLTHLY
jgi:hypothetical protein